MEDEHDQETEDDESERVPPVVEEEAAAAEAAEEEEVDPRDLLTQEQVNYFKSIFMSFDTERKERIPTKTIGYVLRMLGMNPTKAEVKDHMKQIDPRNKGSIDFASFLLPIAQRIDREPETHEDVIAAFKVFDEDEKGYVYTDFLIENLTSLAEDLDDVELELLLKMAETKGTGKIHYVEFVEKMFGIVRKPSKKEKAEKKKKKKKEKK